MCGTALVDTYPDPARELDELMAGFTEHVTGLAEDAFRTAMFARLAPFLEAHPEALRTEDAPPVA